MPTVSQILRPRNPAPGVTDRRLWGANGSSGGAGLRDDGSIAVDGGELAVTTDAVDLTLIEGTFEVNISLWPVEYRGERPDQRLEAARQLGVAIIDRLP